MPCRIGGHAEDPVVAREDEPFGPDLDGPLERAASFGQWWHDGRTGCGRLSAAAAESLEVGGPGSRSLDACLTHVVEDDLDALVRQWTQAGPGSPDAIDVRVLGPAKGLRWLRSTRLPADPARPDQRRGVLQDITELQHAAVRERLGFELTEFLVGTHPLGVAITNVIQLICNNLGWDWGAYWQREGEDPGVLRCRHFWHPASQDLPAFSAASEALTLRPGEGLVGSVWASGQAQWVEDMRSDPRFLPRTHSRPCGLSSGYVFPVTYVSEHGEEHRPGVLEFYSNLARQPDAQLPRVSALIGTLIAQTARRLETEAEIRRLAEIDELTDLDNRAHFYAELNRQCTLASLEGRSFALMFIDLDRFKAVNDAFGHDAGNAVLRAFARRLKDLAPPGAHIGRLGGDEFALLPPPGIDDATLATLLQQALAAASHPFGYEGVALNVSASIGVSRFPENGQTGPELLRSADAAMYRAKQEGRNGSTVFSTSNPDTLALQRARLAEGLAIETELHQALRDERLVLVYQPIFELASGRLSGAEALIRWPKADGTMVPPGVFIPIAERSGLIVDIGRRVIGQAFRDLATLNRSALAGLEVHVNMAAPEFTCASLPETLRSLADTWAVPPSQVVLELTETMLMKQPDEVLAVMRRLRDLGFQIALDDFGMGHSSLSVLKNLPLSSLKIDRSFVCDLAGEGRDRAIAETIVDLGRHMRLKVIAEGIENAEQLRILREGGCGHGQGFLLGRPMSIESLLARHGSHAAGPARAPERPS